MAIDTAAKRKSTVAVGLHFLRMGVIPDGSNLEAAQRLHTQGLYSGIAASSPGGFVRAWAAGSNVLLGAGAVY